MSAAIQTVWAEKIVAALALSGVSRCVVSPGSRSTPLVAALARGNISGLAIDVVTLIDERAAAFFALGAARADGAPVALVCTSGSAAAHYLPAIVEASMADVPLVVLTADRPPELIDCGASQTIDQVKMYGGFVRGAFDLGAPADSELALRAVQRKITQACTRARGPHPGPVHVNVPLRKPLEPAEPTTDRERALVAAARKRVPVAPAAPPIAMPQPALVAGLAAAIAAEPDGVIVAGAMPARFAAARAAVLELARRAGYPIIAEAGSQLRLGPVPDGAVIVHHVDLIPPGELPAPGLVIQLGAEPVAAAWPGWLAKLTASGAARWVLAGHTWNDADASAHGVILGDVAATIAAVRDAVPSLDRPPPSGWRTLDAGAGRALDAALAAHPDNEASVLRAALAALPGNAVIQVGNSLPIRVLDQIAASATPHPVLTQRGAAGIDGLIASAAGATWSGRQPVLLVLGDVSFAHDLGGLLAARASRAPFAVLVIDNGGGQIFGGLPIARAELGDRFVEHWLTPPAVDPVAVARALGLDGVRAETPDAVAEAIRAALQRQVPAIIHAPVRASGARDVRRTALERFGG